MLLTLIRHGESESNVIGRWQGHGDSPLSAHGRHQASLLAERLRRETFAACIGSDLQRAAETGRAFLATLEVDPVWREIDVGRWEGLTRAEVAERFAAEVAAVKAGAQDVSIGGGESWEGLARRAREAVVTLCGRHPREDHVAVFSHGGLITTVIADVLGAERRHPRPLARVSNTAMTTIDYGAPRPEVVRFNDAGHLGPQVVDMDVQLEAGAAALVLVAEQGGGRSEKGRPETERAQRWCGAFDVVWDDARCTAAKSEPATAAAEIAERHGGATVAMPLEAEAIPAVVAAICDFDPARLRAPASGSLTRIVLTSEVRRLADYNVAVRFAS